MDNPLLTTWQTTHQLPPYDLIKSEHYLPAFKQSLSDHVREINCITNNKNTATFENTIEDFEATGQLLEQISSVFFTINAAHTSDELAEINSEISPLVAAHYSSIYSNKDLFERVHSVYQSSTHLDYEQQALLNSIYKKMQRSGAALNEEKRQKIIQLDTNISTLETTFEQNVLKDTNKFQLWLSEDDISGLPATVLDSAAAAAQSMGHSGKHLITLSRSSYTPFMAYSNNRDSREKMWRAYTSVGNNNNEYDNNKVAQKIAMLRAQRASILGFESHAHFMLDDRMAESTSNVRDLLDRLWGPTQSKVLDEVKELQYCAQSEGDNFTIEPWDWWFYTEKLRQQKFDLDSEIVKPYFELERVRQGAFDVATKLYGITFKAIDYPNSYHEDVEAFEVSEKDGSLIGVFLADYFMRPSKRSGAWMNELRSQKKFGGVDYPIICNTCNFAKGSPTLLGSDEVRTLFHEFGHALHGLLSKVTYKSLSGTFVKRDFVELPSQIMEHWATEPEVLRSFARHYNTGDVIPDSLIEKMLSTETFNQGFATTEYLAASYLDMQWHEIQSTDPELSGITTEQLEHESMTDIELIDQIAPRYRSTYFQHIFSGGYSAGYYSYIWAEVLDTDAFEEFKKEGIFDSKTADSFRKNILERGGTDEPMSLYKKFKGREPEVAPLLVARGLK